MINTSNHEFMPVRHSLSNLAPLQKNQYLKTSPQIVSLNNLHEIKVGSEKVMEDLW